MCLKLQTLAIMHSNGMYTFAQNVDYQFWGVAIRETG